MKTAAHEIADGIVKIRTDIPDEGGGFTFNQFVIKAEQPLLVHTGPKQLFPSVSKMVGEVIDPSTLRWIIVGHLEDDECGSLKLWHDIAPGAQVPCLPLLHQAGIGHFANDPLKVDKDEIAIDLGTHRVRLFATPHFTHAWESQTLYEESTKTLFAGDFGAQLGVPPIIDQGDAAKAAMEAEKVFQSTNVSPLTIETIRRFQGMPIDTLAIMHGSSVASGVPQFLNELHDFYLSRLQSNVDSL